MKILLDTSLLLPTLGIEVERDDKILKKHRDYELYYSDFSILECLWVVNSLKRKGKFDRDSFETGIRCIFECYAKAEINAEIILRAFEIYEMSHKDIIDCILYSIALSYNMKFASIDSELKKFIKNNNLKYVFLNNVKKTNSGNRLWNRCVYY